MCARAYVAVSYVGDAIMPHVGHADPFKVPREGRYFCLRTCLHMYGPVTQKCQPCWLAKIITKFICNLSTLEEKEGESGILGYTQLCNKVSASLNCMRHCLKNDDYNHKIKQNTEEHLKTKNINYCILCFWMHLDLYRKQFNHNYFQQ